ncbi:MAG: DNA primase [Cytophagales bacterium]|nr:DNA primase [Cytophagales bacterium]
MVKKEVIDKVFEAADIVEVVSDFVQLRRAGQNLKGLSPFTTEKTPSFVVSPAKGIFKCFSSGKGGNAITFIMEVEGISYIEAIKFLAGKYGIAVEEEEQMSPEELQQQTERDSIFIVLNFAKNHFKKNLHENQQGKMIGLSYFKERGFTDEIIKSFDLGYSLDAWDDLKNAAEAKKYKLDYLEKAGLITVKEGGKVYDRFRARVMFPIHNLTGKVIAFGARTLSNEKNQPKYLNSPETEVYHKSNILYGIFQAKNEIRKEESCFLVEGYTDVISLHQAGIKNVVASSGTALTVEQIRLISRYTKNITVLYDGDKAGIKASMRGIDLILQEGLNVSAVSFPEGEDPDSYVQKIGGDAFKRHIQENQKDFLSFKTELFLEGTENDPILRAEVSKQILESIAKIPDGIKRTIFLQQSSQLLNINYDILVQEYEKIFHRTRNELERQTTRQLSLQQNKTPNTTTTQSQPNQDKDFKQLIFQEEEIVRLLLNYGDIEIDEGVYFAMYVLKEIEEINFEDETCSEIVKAFQEAYGDGILLSANDLLKENNKRLQSFIAKSLMERHEISKNWREKHEIVVMNEQEALGKIAYKVILRLKWRNARYQLKKIQKALASTQEIEEITNLQQQFIKHKQIEMQISKLLGNVIA